MDSRTAEKVDSIAALVRNTDFDSKDVDPDLHKRMEKVVLDGRIKCI